MNRLPAITGIANSNINRVSFPFVNRVSAIPIYLGYKDNKFDNPFSGIFLSKTFLFFKKERERLQIVPAFPVFKNSFLFGHFENLSSCQ